MSPDPRLMRYLFYYVAFLAYLAVGAATLPQLGWYESLTLPWFALPPAVVSAAWLIVFLSGAASVSLFWAGKHPARIMVPVTAMYAGIMLLLVLWNFLFFGIQKLESASWVAFTITLSLIALMLRLRKDAPTADLALIPFVLWMFYASYFNHVIALLNA